MATIPDGEDVPEFLGRLGTTEGVWVAAVGTVSSADLAVAGPEGEVTRSVEGDATLVSLMGPARGPLMAVLATAVGVVGGRLIRANAAGVGFTLLGAAPAAQGSAPSRAAPPPAGKGAPGEDEEADELPLQGDRIDHFVFGLCDVMVVQGERFKIREVGGGKLREIHVGPFRLSKPVVRDGKRVFKLVKRS